MNWQPDPQLDAVDYLIAVMLVLALVVLVAAAIAALGWWVLVLLVAAVGAWVYLVKRGGAR